MVSTVLQAILDTLQESGINAVLRLPESRIDFGGEAVVCVGVKRSLVKSPGMGDYLGIRKNALDQSVNELYGLKMEAVISLNIYSPPGDDMGSRECTAVYSALCSALAQVSGNVKFSGITMLETKFDRELGLFFCPVEAECQAYLVGERDADLGEFLEFELKGVIKNVNQ